MNFYWRWRPKEISFKLGIPIRTIMAYIVEFRKCLKKRASINRRFLGKKKLLSKDHEEYLGQVIKHQHDSIMTLEDMKKKLKNQFLQIEEISVSTIGRCLKGCLGMSYKKLSTVGVKMFEKENMMKMIRWACVINKLLKVDFEIIFCDEFSVSMRNFKFYGCSPKGLKAIWKKKKSDSFCWSFMVALSNYNYYGLFGTNKTF